MADKVVASFQTSTYNACIRHSYSTEPIWRCEHEHKTADAAKACAAEELQARKSVMDTAFNDRPRVSIPV